MKQYRYPPNSMPILFQNHEIMVYKNGSGEIFIETKSDPAVRMRVSPSGSELVVTSGNGGGTLTPYSVGGLPAFIVHHP